MIGKIKLYLFLLLFLILSSTHKATAQRTQPQHVSVNTTLGVFTFLLRWVDETADKIASISDKHKREEATDKLKWLLNDIDVLFTTEKFVIAAISRTDSIHLIPERARLLEKNDTMTQGLQTMVGDLQRIKPLLNETIHGSQTDSLVFIVQDYFEIRKSITLSEIGAYLSGSPSVTRAEVLEDGNIGLGLLQQCKSDLSKIIDKLTVQ